jgi:hypothetical protein
VLEVDELDKLLGVLELDDELLMLLKLLWLLELLLLLTLLKLL